MSELRILYGLPALSGIAIAFVLLGPGARRHVEAARAYGVPVVGATRFAVRVESVRRYAELEEPFGGPVELEWTHGATVIGAAAATAGGDGWVELAGELSAPLPTDSRLTLRRSGSVLGEGDVLAVASLAVQPSRSCESTGNTGKLQICVLRGVAVPESPEQVQVTWSSRGGEGHSKATLEFSASGGDVQKLRMSPGPVCDANGCSENWIYTVVARAPAVALDVELRAAAEHVTYHGDLPLQPGGIWLDPASRREARLMLRSATPRSAAYLSLLGEKGRLWGGVVPLASEPNGFSGGTLPVSALPAFAEGPLTLILASDPSEPKSYVVAWPLGSGERVATVTSMRLVDGVPGAIEREEKRARAIRRPVALLILVGAITVLATLARRVAREKRRLQAHLAGRGESLAIADPRWGLVLGVLAALACAFAALALVAAYG